MLSNMYSWLLASPYYIAGIAGGITALALYMMKPTMLFESSGKPKNLFASEIGIGLIVSAAIMLYFYFYGLVNIPFLPKRGLAALAANMPATAVGGGVPPAMAMTTSISDLLSPDQFN
jgi:hypothetical protein